MVLQIKLQLTCFPFFLQPGVWSDPERSKEVPMHHDNELIIRLSRVEVQQALSIWLDNDAQEALQFVQEKIVPGLRTVAAGNLRLRERRLAA